jgi:hypothetical protein
MSLVVGAPIASRSARQKQKKLDGRRSARLKLSLHKWSTHRPNNRGESPRITEMTLVLTNHGCRHVESLLSTSAGTGAPSSDFRYSNARTDCRIACRARDRSSNLAQNPPLPNCRMSHQESAAHLTEETGFHAAPWTIARSSSSAGWSALASQSARGTDALHSGASMPRKYCSWKRYECRSISRPRGCVRDMPFVR